MSNSSLCVDANLVIRLVADPAPCVSTARSNCTVGR
jgi:hypothetical protein